MAPESLIPIVQQTVRSANSEVAMKFATNRIVATLLFGITSTDVPTYVGVLLTAMLLVIAASAIPAARAARVDAMRVLKTE